MKRVYFLKPIGMAGPIKIGCSKFPENRLMAFDIWSPFPLELIASAPGEMSDEGRLHWRFRKDRTHGEWFLVSVDLLNLIDHVRLSGCLPPLEEPASGTRHGSRKSRNLAWRTEKTRLGRRMNKAEIHAWGWHGRHGQRPADIDVLREKCVGATTRPLRGADLARVEEYIAGLLALPCGAQSELNLRAKAEGDARWEAHRAANRAAREQAGLAA